MGLRDGWVISERLTITKDRTWIRTGWAPPIIGVWCTVHGYNRSKAALVFHHRDPFTKEFNIGSNCSRTWVSIKKELDKCDLLCANCHAEIHTPVFQLVGNQAYNLEAPD